MKNDIGMGHPEKPGDDDQLGAGARVLVLTCRETGMTALLAAFVPAVGHPMVAAQVAGFDETVTAGPGPRRTPRAKG